MLARFWNQWLSITIMMIYILMAPLSQFRAFEMHDNLIVLGSVTFSAEGGCKSSDTLLSFPTCPSQLDNGGIALIPIALLEDEFLSILSELISMKGFDMKAICASADRCSCRGHVLALP